MKKITKKAETPLYENKAEIVPIENKAPKVGVEVIKAYDGIEVGTIITNPDANFLKYMIENGYWK
jgi:hypothetical protein